MTLGLTCAHEWTRDTRPTSPTSVILACTSCGTASVSHGTLRANVVTASLDIYPPNGASTVTPDLYDFFVRQWDAECMGLASAGFTVNRRPPIIHPMAWRPSASLPLRSPWLSGRDVAVATAVALVCGVLMLVVGLSFDVSWLAAVGGIILGVLALLMLLVVFLSS